MDADRNEAVWYYRLGEQTLGPVPWSEIEGLLARSADPQTLLVARGGGEQWLTAAQVLGLPAEQVQCPKCRGRGSYGGGNWMSATPIHKCDRCGGTGMVPGTVAAEQAPSPPRPAVSSGPVPVEFGISRWITQAWEVVIGDVWPWVGAVALTMLIGGLTGGIAAMPMTVGLYMMALRRFEGRRLGAGDVFEGFQRFWSAIGLWLLMMIPMTVLMLPFAALIIAMIVGAQAIDERVMPFMVLGFYALYPVLWVAMLGVQTIFFWSTVLVADGHGAWDAVVLSWERVRTQFWSYLGMYLLLTLIASMGSYACYVGIFVTMPLLPCATVAAYRWHFRRA